MSRPLSSPRWNVPVALALSLAALLGAVVAGCSSDSATAPQVNGAPDAAARDVAPLSLGSLIDRLRGDGDDPKESEWTVVAKQRVLPDRRTVVQGSHYTLTFPKGAVSKPVDVTVRERDRMVIDVQLGPDGTQFNKPVSLVIDYRGTTADILSPHWDGTLPILYLLDESTGLWGLLSGVNNILTRQYTINLEHFSRYAFRPAQGTAGWN